LKCYRSDTTSTTESGLTTAWSGRRGFSPPQGLCRLKRVISSPGVGSDFAAALLIALSAALLAGIYPAWRLGRMEAAEALRSE